MNDGNGVVEISFWTKRLITEKRKNLPESIDMMCHDPYQNLDQKVKTHVPKMPDKPGQDVRHVLPGN